MKNEANELWELNRPRTQRYQSLGANFASKNAVTLNLRLGAMGLAERKEVNLDFSKEDEEKRPQPTV